MGYFLLLLFSFVFSIILMPVLRNLGIKYHFCDEPKEDKLKIHTKPIPYLGGIGIFLTMTLGLLLASIFQKILLMQTIGLITSGGIIIALGLWDDFKLKRGKPRPLLKLFIQFLAALFVSFILIKTGINLQFFSYQLLIILISIFYLILVMNAINMEDGMNGLAGGLVIISSLGFVILSLLMSNSLALIFSLMLAGSVLGFLIYNWNPASIFMGDNGSHFLGFSLVILTIIFIGHPFYNLKWFIAPIFIVGLPIIEVGLTIIRRVTKSKSPLMGDRLHLYDRLHQKGLTIPQTALICYMIQAILVISGILIIAN